MGVTPSHKQGTHEPANSLEERSDLELTRLICSNSAKAWDTLYLRHHDFIYWFARDGLNLPGRDQGETTKRMAAEDFVQDLYVILGNERRRFCKYSGAGSFKNWYRVVVKNIFADIMRKRAKKDPLYDPVSLDEEKKEGNPNQDSLQRRIVEGSNEGVVNAENRRIEEEIENETPQLLARLSTKERAIFRIRHLILPEWEDVEHIANETGRAAQEVLQEIRLIYQKNNFRVFKSKALKEKAETALSHLGKLARNEKELEEHLTQAVESGAKAPAVTELKQKLNRLRDRMARQRELQVEWSEQSINARRLPWKQVAEIFGDLENTLNKQYERIFQKKAKKNIDSARSGR